MKVIYSYSFHRFAEIPQSQCILPLLPSHSLIEVLLPTTGPLHMPLPNHGALFPLPLLTTHPSNSSQPQFSSWPSWLLCASLWPWLLPSVAQSRFWLHTQLGKAWLKFILSLTRNPVRGGTVSFLAYTVYWVSCSTLGHSRHWVNRYWMTEWILFWWEELC